MFYLVPLMISSWKMFLNWAGKLYELEKALIA